MTGRIKKKQILAELADQISIEQPITKFDSKSTLSHSSVLDLHYSFF
jgi:hypothetical protein